MRRFIAAAAALAVLGACAAEPSPSPYTFTVEPSPSPYTFAVEPSPAAESSAVPAGTAEPGAAAPTPETEPSAGDAELLELYERCADVRGDTAAYLERLEELGFCAVDKQGRFDMVNWEQLDAVLTAGEGTGELVVICSDGGFEYVTLADGRISTKRVAAAGGSAAVTWENTYGIERLDYTGRGWLIITRIMPDNPEGGWHDGREEPTLLFRVRPPADELRRAAAEYIEPVGYASNFLLRDWDAGSMEAVDFTGLFPAAYALHYGRDLFYYETPYQTDATGFGALVPAEEFESIMLPLFELTAGQLRQAAAFDGQSYHVSMVRTADARLEGVIPDVTGVRDNGDGTLDVTVCGVSAALATDRAFEHTVTVRPGGEGVKYLGNSVAWSVLW